jgi:hypothetical protein
MVPGKTSMSCAQGLLRSSFWALFYPGQSWYGPSRPSCDPFKVVPHTWVPCELLVNRMSRRRRVCAFLHFQRTCREPCRHLACPHSHAPFMRFIDALQVVSSVFHKYLHTCLRRAWREALSCPVWIDSHVYMSGFRTHLSSYIEWSRYTPSLRTGNV